MRHKGISDEEARSGGFVRGVHGIRECNRSATVLVDKASGKRPCQVFAIRSSLSRHIIIGIMCVRFGETECERVARYRFFVCQ